MSGYFAASSRYGTPQELMYLIERFHQEGIGVILDWVPSHFPGDAHALYRFDGTHLYEHADVRKGLVKHLDNLNAIKGESLINTNPVRIQETESVADMVKLLNNLNFIVLFLPVVDSNNVLKGAVLLNHLTRV